MAALAAAFAGCGGGDGGSGSGAGVGGADGAAPPAGEEAPVRLAIRVSDGSGETRTAALTCGAGTARATGFLSPDAEGACRDARRLAPFLADEPDADRVCTQVYGGPQTARIEGSVAGRAVDRRLARADGCEIAAWDRAAPLLGEPPAMR